MSYDDLFDDLAPQGTVRFTLDGVRVRSSKPVALVLRHAGESNTAFQNARRKADSQLKAHTGDATAEVLRPVLIGLFAKHVITGWENVVSADGNPTSYSADECEQFLTALAKRGPDIVDAMISFAFRADNFRDPIGSAEALGKK